MSKSSTASAQKIPTQLPTKSAWAKGPPSTSSSAPTPRSQSPAPNSNAIPPTSGTHSRKPSTLGQGISIKDGVSVPRGNVGAVKQGSAVTFGSIDDVGAPISSSPAAAPAVKTEGVKSFGSVPATGNVNGKTTSTTSATPVTTSKPTLIPSANGTSASTTTSTSTATPSPAPSTASTSNSASSSTPATTTPSKHKVEIKKLFQGSSGPSQPSNASETASPSTRPSDLPNQQRHPSSQQPQPGQQPPPSQPSQLGAHSFTPFVPNRGLPTQQNNGPARGPPGSPVYSRQQLANGSGRPPGGPNGPGGPPMSAGMSSPRLAPHTHPGQQPGMPPPPQPMPVPGWPGYYYQQDPMQAYYGGWYMPPASPMPHQQQLPHHPQHHPPPGPPGPPTGMPMSPRNPPPPLQNQVPGTPTQTHALPTSHTPHPPPSSHSNSNSISNITSPPQTPSHSAHANLPGSGSTSARLNTNANAFVPGRSSKIVIKSATGEEVDISTLKKASPGPGPPASPALSTFSNTPGNRRSVVRMESEEAKQKRLAEEKEKAEKERAKKEAQEKAKKEAEEKAKREEEERIAAEKKKKEEEKERLRKEEEERIRKEEEEKERIRREEEEKERKRKEEEERERLKKEEEERLKKEEEERLKREEEERLKKEEEERIRKAEEEKKAAEEAERKKKEEEETKAKAEAEAAAKEKEDGEVADDKEPTKESAKSSRENLRIDTSTAHPSPEPRRRPGPLNLSGAQKRDSIPAPLPSALSTARNIEDINSVSYPEGIQSPKLELNTNAKDGKFKYDRDFLLQFMSICKEKPDSLPPLDAIGLEPSEQHFPMSRGGSGRHGSRPSSMAAPGPRSASVGLGIGSFSKSTSTGPFSMGNFSTPGSKLSSEERFALATGRTVSMSGAANLPFPRPSPMVRTPSQGGPGHPSNRTRSKRGEKRNEANKAQSHQQGHGGQQPLTGPGGVPLEPVAPLELSANRWVAASASRKPQAVDQDSPEIVDRKVKALLNKLTMEKFDSISDQIITWANKSEKEKDGRTLIQVIRLVFEKATDEAAWSEMYARLCRKMMETISPKVQDDGIKNSEGKPIAGGQLFRKYLLNRCQEDFERGWAAKDAAAAAAKDKASQDEAVRAANETNKNEDNEPVLYSDEYYAAQKAKRQGLGLIRFIGELFKLQMLTERIMHECIKKLLGNVENPEEEEIESLCKLLTTVGQILDTNKARAHMDVYFSRMKELTKSPNVGSRMQYMLQDVIELRERKWVPRGQVTAPTTIAQIHDQAAKAAAAEKEQYRQISMSRGGSRRGGERGQYDQTGPDGWTTAGAGGPPRAAPKAGDLSKFGQINKSSPMTFGPSSVFAGKKDAKGRAESLSRTNSSSNMFSMLSQNPEAAEAASKSSRPPSRKTSVDLGSSATPEAPPQRKRLQLLPRTKPTSEEEAPRSANASDDGESEAPTMSEADAKKKIDEDLKEFFAIRNLDEAEGYFTDLPSEHRFRLVDKLVTSAVESKEADAQLVSDLFGRAVSKDLCSAEAFETGFASIAEFLDDIAIDAPKAPNLFATMMKGAGLDKDQERRQRIVSKSMDNGDKLESLLSS